MQILPGPTPSLLKYTGGSPKNEHRIRTNFDKEKKDYFDNTREISFQINEIWFGVLLVNPSNFKKI